ncbi:hypothetical protein M3Y97_00957900 [Aphelenchoides bicaudatus]|nr:hypothetical protein M3Y97_00957900 [Aphelenchoides bicaudatus]
MVKSLNNSLGDDIVIVLTIVAILAYLYYAYVVGEHKPNEVYVTYTVVMPSAKKKLTGTAQGHEVETARAQTPSTETAKSHVETARNDDTGSARSNLKTAESNTPSLRAGLDESSIR